MWEGTGGNFSGEKFPPDPFQKTFGQGVRGDAAPEFYRCGGMVQEFVRSAIGDPDLRSPSGFDSGLRPPRRMTREGRGYAISMRGNHYAMVAPALFIDVVAHKQTKAFSSGRRWQPQADG